MNIGLTNLNNLNSLNRNKNVSFGFRKKPQPQYKPNFMDFDTFKTQAITHHSSSLKPNTNKLSIFYCNDMHGNTDSMAGLVAEAKIFDQQKRGHGTFTISGGDNVSGGDSEKNKFVHDLLQNGMKVDVSAVGNHEIDATSGGFNKALANIHFDYVASNVDFDDDNPLNDKVKKSLIKVENGVKYGFVGAMPIDFKSCTKKAVQGDLEVSDFDDSVEEIQEEVDKLKKQGVDRIIMVSHSGYETDKKYAKNLDGVDIIIGGHTHTVVEGAKQGENVVTSKSGEPVVITQAGENGKHYGILDVEFDAKGVIRKVENQLNTISAVKKSPIIEYIKKKELGESPQVGVISKIDPMPKNRRIVPHAWSNFVVDSMKSEMGTDIALLNAANIRKIPAEGIVTERDISESAPMKNKLIKTTVTQKQVVQAIREASKQTLTGENGEPGFLFASGLTYKVDKTGNLLEMNFVDKNGKKTPIDINNPSDKVTYTAIYDDFTMRGDGEYPALAPKFPVEYFEYDKDLTAINAMKKNKGAMEFIDDKRLEIVDTSQTKQASNNSQKFLDLTLSKAS